MNRVVTQGVWNVFTVVRADCSLNGVANQAATLWKSDCVEEVTACVAEPVKAELYQHQIYLGWECFSSPAVSLLSHFVQCYR